MLPLERQQIERLERDDSNPETNFSMIQTGNSVKLIQETGLTILVLMHAAI